MEQAANDSPIEEAVRLLRAGEIDEGIKVLGDILRADMDDARAHMLIGIAYGKKSDKLHAIHHLETSVNLDENPKALFNLGMIYEASHRVDEAVRQYRRAIQLDPNYSMAQEALHKLQEQFSAAHIQDLPAEEETVEPPHEPETQEAHEHHRQGGLRNLLRFHKKDNSQ